MPNSFILKNANFIGPIFTTSNDILRYILYLFLNVFLSDARFFFVKLVYIQLTNVYRAQLIGRYIFCLIQIEHKNQG